MSAWFDELDLDPASSWRRMGTRALGERPWLVADERSDVERALRARLFADLRSDVFVAAPPDVGEEVWSLVQAHTGISERPDLDPLAAAGLAIQEDLCLLRRRDGAWHLDAAFVCFPSRWRLADKIGRPLVDVHGPTPGYDVHLAPKVDRLLDRLTARQVMRRNWFVHPDPALHQPVAPDTDPIVPASRAMRDLFVRSERQTLRSLDCGWILFTIRIQHDALGDALSNEDRRARFRRYVAEAPMRDLDHRGVSPPQVDELCQGLGIAARVPKSDTTSDL